MFNSLKIQRLAIFTLVFLIIFSFFSTVLIALAGDNSPDFNKEEREPFKYKLMVPLPTGSGTVATTTGIVDYIKTLYLFGMGIAGVLAMTMIIVGGFQWMGGGSITSTKAAKSRISNAVLGLVLLLAAYLILNTINPALVNLKEPYIYFIEWYKDFPDDGSTGPGPGGGTPDYCTDASITSCPQYTGPFYSDCLTNPCGVPGNCYYNGVFLCRLCDVNNCSEYISNESCTADPCGKGPCKIGAGGACVDQ